MNKRKKANIHRLEKYLESNGDQKDYRFNRISGSKCSERRRNAHHRRERPNDVTRRNEQEDNDN